jgi:hypothetical protein
MIIIASRTEQHPAEKPKQNKHAAPKTSTTALTNMTQQMRSRTPTDLDVADDLTGLILDKLNANLDTDTVRSEVETLAVIAEGERSKKQKDCTRKGTIDLGLLTMAGDD